MTGSSNPNHENLNLRYNSPFTSGPPENGSARWFSESVQSLISSGGAPSMSDGVYRNWKYEGTAPIIIL